MLSPTIYPWFSAYRAAVLEPDFTLVPERVREALRFIQDRVSGPAQMLKWTIRNDRPLLKLARAWVSSTESLSTNGTLGPLTIS